MIYPLIIFRCDADPSALAKYVVALIKKEKPLNELRDVCVDQLDVFLADGKTHVQRLILLYLLSKSACQWL